MKISILGTGRWASCIGFCLDRKKCNLLMWQREHKDRPESGLFVNRTNEYVTLSNRVKLTHDLKQAINFGDVIIISILSQQVDNLMQSIKQVPGYENKIYCLAMKGVEVTTGRRLSEILIDNGVNKDNIAVWVGPGHVQSIFAGQPTNMLVSAYKRNIGEMLVKLFTDEKKIDIVYENDIIGAEIGAAAKNVIGIASGVLEGSGLEQKKGPLISASIKEIGELIDAEGGDKYTSMGLSFAGEIESTFFSKNSKNLTYGKLIAQHKTLNVDEFGINSKSVEGIATAKALVKKQLEFNSRVSEEKQLKMPITNAVNDIVSGKVDLDVAGQYMSEKVTESIMLK